MPDAIPGATYYDPIFNTEFICNGITSKDGEDVVVLEYANSDETVRVGLELFKRDDRIKVSDLPE